MLPGLVGSAGRVGPADMAGQITARRTIAGARILCPAEPQGPVGLHRGLKLIAVLEAGGQAARRGCPDGQRERDQQRARNRGGEHRTRSG